MDVGNCQDCQVRRDLHWEVQYYKAQHARALERESRWRKKAEKSEKEARALAAENRRLSERLEASEARVAWLEQQVFGRKTERTEMSPGEEDDGAVAGGGDEGTTLGGLPTDRRHRGKQRGAPGQGRKRRCDLPTEEILHDLPDEQKVCPRCGKPLAPFPGTEDSEEIHWDVRVVRRVHRRRRYRPTCQCKAVAGIIAAPCPAKLIPKGMFSCGFWVELLLNKFLHGMPLFRILQTLEMNHLFVSQGTLTGGLKKIGELLQPIYVRILERSRAAHHWHMDETRWMVFEDVAGKAHHRWWLWVVRTTDTCAYLVDPSRSSDVPLHHLGPQAEGIISADRYSAYKVVQKRVANLLIAFCWAHVRRDFLRLGEGNKKLAPWAEQWVGRINELFRINGARVKSKADSRPFHEADQSLREALEQMARTRDDELAAPTLHSGKRKALTSLREHWPGLTIFVDHPNIPLDNNEAERRIRHAVVGRKNYYGSGAIWSGALTAALFTILQTLRVNRISPKPWLLAYFEACARNGGRVPDNLDDFLPWNLPEHGKSQWQCTERPP